MTTSPTTEVPCFDVTFKFPDDFLLQFSKGRCQNIDRPFRNNRLCIRSKRGNDKPVCPGTVNKIRQVRGEWIGFRFCSDGTQHDLTCRKITRDKDTELLLATRNRTLDPWLYIKRLTSGKLVYHTNDAFTKFLQETNRAEWPNFGTDQSRPTYAYMGDTINNISAKLTNQFSLTRLLALD